MLPTGCSAIPGFAEHSAAVCRASYIHTSIVYLALVIFVFKIYASDEASIGSPGKVCDLHVVDSFCTIFS